MLNFKNKLHKNNQVLELNESLQPGNEHTVEWGLVALTKLKIHWLVSEDLLYLPDKKKHTRFF